MENFTSTFGNTAANALPAERASFIRKTYLLLAAAILAFIVVEGFLYHNLTLHVEIFGYSIFRICFWKRNGKNVPRSPIVKDPSSEIH